MGFLVFRMWYFPQAQNKWQALDFLREAEEKGIDKDFFVNQWAKEGEPQEHKTGGWWAGFKKQLGGKK